MKTFGSGQTTGLPLRITATTFAGRQTLHTFPAGGATPNVVRIYATNLDTSVGHTIHVEVENVGGATLRSILQVIPLQSGLYPVLEGDNNAELVLNGACTIKVWADTTNKIDVSAVVDNQADTSGCVSQALSSGLIASVQNAQRYGVYVNGGVGDATEANGQLMISRAGTLQNLVAGSDAAVGGGATVTVTVRINGVATALIQTFANADGTTLKYANVAVPVAVGDLVTFEVSCDNVGAPAANLQAAVEYIAQ
jgi:hypothetical protein